MELKSLKEIAKGIRYSIRDHTHNRQFRDRVKARDFTIISADCIGGVIYHELHQRIDTPTVNLFFSAHDFVKFCKNLEFYVHCEILPCNTGGEYIQGMLGDIILNLVHYNSVEQANQKWQERKERIHYDNLFLIMSDRNGCTEKEIAAFDALPFENKVIFTHKPYPQYKSSYYLPGSEKNEFVKTTTDYVYPLWIRRRYDAFDFAEWLNSGSKYRIN